MAHSILLAIALASGIYGTRLIKLSGNYRKKALSYAAIANLETQNVATAQAAVNHPDPVFRARYARVLRKVAENCAVRIEHFKSMERKYSARPFMSGRPSLPIRRNRPVSQLRCQTRITMICIYERAFVKRGRGLLPKNWSTR